jgi:nucleoside phosphorylase
MLILAAVREELDVLPGETVGIGPVVAAARAAAILERRHPAAVILIGTAGAYPGGPEIGTVIAAERLGLGFAAAAMGVGYTPRPPPDIDGDPDLLSRLALPRFAVLTTGAVTTDPEFASRLAETYLVEHLEAYGVAYACQELGIPFTAVLGISNKVGPDAHAEWLTWRDVAQERARDAVRGMLS